MTMSARVAFATLVLTGYGVLSRSGAAEETPGITAKAAFDRLKTLEGEWNLVGKEKHAEHAKVVYKVTAAGSTLMETQFPGKGHEMVTMYHLDGKDLKVTHYCAARNQPRFKLDLKASKPDFYSFVFDGGSNLDPDKDMHIHSFQVAFLEGGKVESEWETYTDGKKSDTTKFPMSRP